MTDKEEQARNDSKASFLAQLDALRAEYASALPERLGEIDQTWESVKKSPGEAAVWKKLERMVHSLAGSGGSFGFHALSQAARQLEHHLHTLMAKDETISSTEIEHIESELADMKRSTLVISDGKNNR